MGALRNPSPQTSRSGRALTPKACRAALKALAKTGRCRAGYLAWSARKRLEARSAIKLLARFAGADAGESGEGAPRTSKTWLRRPRGWPSRASAQGAAPAAGEGPWGSSVGKLAAGWASSSAAGTDTRGWKPTKVGAELDTSRRRSWSPEPRTKDEVDGVRWKERASSSAPMASDACDCLRSRS